MPYFFYVLKSRVDGSYYKGRTDNLKDRLRRHNGSGSKFTKSKKPWELVYTEEYASRSEASKRESFLKSPRGWQEWQAIKKKIETAISERGAAR